MKVLLTGHTGYLGSVMAGELVADGHEVTGLDTGYFAERVLGPVPPGLDEVRMDLRDVGPAQCEGFDAVIHLAALSNDPLGELDPAVTYDINQHASVQLARAAKEAGVGRFLYASTCSVYGTSGGDALVDETAPLAPITAYAISKVAVEDELVRLADDSFVTTALRNATAYGFSPRLRADIVLNNLVGWALLTGVVKVLSDGTPWRPLVHARDISGAFRAVLGAAPDVVGGEAFNVGSERDNLTVAQIAQIVAEVVPDARVEITGEAGGDPRSYRVDFGKISRLVPEFVPQWDVRRGAQELLDAYRGLDLTQESFTHDFVRLQVLREHIDAGRVDPDSLRWW